MDQDQDITIDASALIDQVRNQRNQALDQLAQANAVIEYLQAKLRGPAPGPMDEESQ